MKTPIEVRCPRCGEVDDLHGSPKHDHLEIECACGMQWIRTPKAVCPQCGGDQIVTKSEHILQKARGDLMSIVGSRPLQLCVVCDADQLRVEPDTRLAHPEDPWK